MFKEIYTLPYENVPTHILYTDINFLLYFIPCLLIFIIFHPIRINIYNILFNVLTIYTYNVLLSTRRREFLNYNNNDDYRVLLFRYNLSIN